MARAKTKQTKKRQPVMVEIDAAQLRADLDRTVQAEIARMAGLDEAEFQDAWARAMRLTPPVEGCLRALVPAAFDDGPYPQSVADLLLIAPPLVAPVLAAQAFHPGGVRVGHLHWVGQHAAAESVVPYRITFEEEGPLEKALTGNGINGGFTGLHRLTAQALVLLFPVVATALAAVQDHRFTLVQTALSRLNTESALFTEALVVGGPAPLMEEALAQLVDAIAGMAAMPGGVAFLGRRWEIVV